jgi:hypothetical protein
LLGREWRIEDGFGSLVFGDEVGMLAQAIARAFDLGDHGMMQRAIEQRGRRRFLFQNV